MKNTNHNIDDRQARLGGIIYLVSIGIHFLLFVVLSLFFKIFESDSVLPGYYSLEIETVKGNLNNRYVQPKNESDKIPNLKNPSEMTDKPVESNNQENVLRNDYDNIKTAGFDSTTLNQVYKEPTLNVSLKYPLGWVYMDQDRENKLDGITFWAAAGDYNPPPYIHVEVVDKYMFIPDQYKYKYDFKNFEGYYNDPVEMENQFTQSIYLKTNDDEDFIIKLIMTGNEQFHKFQPVFFSMVNSFRFGKSFF